MGKDTPVVEENAHRRRPLAHHRSVRLSLLVPLLTGRVCSDAVIVGSYRRSVVHGVQHLQEYVQQEE